MNNNMKSTIAAIAITLALVGFAQARKVVVLSPEEITSGVQRAASGVPVLRSAMKDPDSFVLEGVYLRPPNKQGISDVCYSYRAHNSYGGYSGTGTARLNSKGAIDSFGSSSDDELKQALMPCSPLVQSMSLDVTAQVNAIVHPTAAVLVHSLTRADRQAVVDAMNAKMQKEGVAGYVEIAGDMLTVHSERATPLRWHAMLLNKVEMDGLYQMEITTLVYTNDADQKFVYDLTKNVEVK